MNLDEEDQHLSEQLHEGQKKDRISYTRDFLLSLSELDVCKKLPSEFDPSIFSEFEGFFPTLQDRQRPPGGVSLQSCRRPEYGSSPPARGDSSSYSRGFHGRWDSRPRDSDSQSDWDSDSGRRYGNQSRRSWQNSEHDGLLGSGSFPRPSGYASGASAPKFGANDPSQLKRSNEPYQPPRPYKAVPHSRRDTHDSYNDETFGSADTSDDRSEEERKRRASFELMRKEQHKAFQDKQKSNSDKRKGDSVSGIAALLEDSKDETLFLNRNNETDDSVNMPVSHNDSSKSLLPSQSLASRPLVPPGFTTTSLEKNFGAKSVVHPLPTEVENPKIKDCLSHGGSNPMLNGTFDHEAKQLGQKLTSSEQQLDNTSIDIPFIKMNEKFKLASEVSNRKIGIDDQSFKTSSLSEASDTIELDAEKDSGQNTLNMSNEDHSPSVLQKLFGSALRVQTGDSSSLTEHRDCKRDDTWSPSTVQSSKFAHWFHEEKKTVDDLSSGRTNDLLSLIVGGEEGRFQVSDTKSTEQIPPDFPFRNSDFSKREMTSDLTSATVGISEQLYIGNKPEAVPAVLTCEDLEQSILSEISDNSLALQPPVQGLNVLAGKTGQVKASIDDHASQHLLSLLNKGAGVKDMTSSPSLDTESLDKKHIFEVASMGTALNNSREATSQKVQGTGKTLTLETLFGTAFMNELQSFEAPVSVHRASVGPARVDVPESHGLLFPVNDYGASQSTIGETGSNWTGRESTILASNHRLQKEADRIEGRWLGFNDPRTEVNSSKLKTEVGFKLGGFDGAVDIRLPEEDSLIMASDPLNQPNSMFMPAGEPSKAEILSSLNRPVGVAEKLAAFKDERSMVGGQEGQPFLRGSSQMIEPEMRYQNLRGQPSSLQLHRPQTNHGRPLYHPLDSHPTHFNAQLKFPDTLVHHDPPSNHQFSANMLRPPFHHSNTGLTGFDPPPHPMLQQMQRPGIFPPSHLMQEMQGFPRSTPRPPHPNNQVAGFIREPDSMQGFPIGHRPPNFGGPGMPLPAPDIGGMGSHPEALQRLIEMELRSNPKQIHPLAPHGQGMYGHDLDMGFRHR